MRKALVVLMAISCLAWGVRVVRGDPALDAAVSNAWMFSQSQLNNTATQLQTSQYTALSDANPDDATFGQWSPTSADSWEAGFLPGEMWYMYQQTRTSTWLNNAEAWTTGIIPGVATEPNSIDVGFPTVAAWGNAYRLSGSPTFSARALYYLNSATGTLDSQFNNRDNGQTPVPMNAYDAWNNQSWAPQPNAVIPDSTMDAQVAFQAWALGGSPSLGAGTLGTDFQDALINANTIAAQNVRADGSTYHVVLHSLTTGAVVGKVTYQGFASESTWSRGQAWTIYSYTTDYGYTKGVSALSATAANYLSTAEASANYFISHLPANNTANPYNYIPGDWVPPSDFNASMGEPVGPYNVNGVPRIALNSYTAPDTSAAAVAASGLLDLAMQAPLAADRQKYFSAATNILRSLTAANVTDPRLAFLAVGSPVAGLLAQGESFWNSPPSSTSYGDYYFLEALARYQPTWSGTGGGNWSNPSNWSNNMVYNTPDAEASFGNSITANSVVTVDQPFTLGTISLNSSAAGYTLSGSGTNTITLATTIGNAAINVYSGSHTIAAPVVMSNALTITVSGASTLTLSSTLNNGGGYQLTKAGPGTLLVTAPQIQAPGSIISVSAGMLSLHGPSAAATGAGTWSVASGGTLQLDDSQGSNGNRLGSAAIALWGGTFSYIGGGAGSSQSVGSLVPGFGASSVVVSGASPSLTFASLASPTPGATVNFVGSGIAVNGLGNTEGIVGGWAVSGPDFATVSNGTIGAFSSYIQGDLGAGGGSAGNFEPTGTQSSVTSETINSLNLTGTVGATITNGNTLTIASGGLIANTSGTVSGGNLTAGSVGLIVHALKTLVLSSEVTGAGVSLTKSGSNLLILSSTGNNYGGATWIDAGTFRAGASGVMPNYTGVTIASGATFDLNGYNEAIGSLAGSGGVTLGAGTLTTGANGSSTSFSGAISGGGGLVKTGGGLFNLSGGNSYSGGTSVNGGTLQAGAVNCFSPNSTYTVAGGATLDLAGNAQTIGGLGGAGVVTLGSGLLTTGSNGASTTFSGSMIDGAPGTMGALVKVGGGVLTVTGTLGFSGLFNVNGGSVNLQGSDATVTNLAAGAAVTDSGLVRHTVTATSDQNLQFNGALQGNLAFVKAGVGQLALSASNSFTGPCTVAGGTLSLFNSSGAATGVPSWTVDNNAMLLLDNTLASNPNRVASNASVALYGGTVKLIGNSAGTTENAGPLIAGTGDSSLLTSGTSPSLIFASLGQRSQGGVLYFSSNTVKITGISNSNGILGGWAVVGSNFATASSNLVTAYSSYTTGNLGSGSASSNMKPSGTQTAVSTMTINTLNLSGSLGVTINSGGTLTLAAGGLIGSTSGTITGGMITAGTGELIVYTPANLTMASTITGSNVALTKSGSMALILTSAANNYGGPTYINGGTLQVGRPASFPTRRPSTWPARAPLMFTVSTKPSEVSRAMESWR